MVVNHLRGKLNMLYCSCVEVSCLGDSGILLCWIVEICVDQNEIDRNNKSSRQIHNDDDITLGGYLNFQTLKRTCR